MDKPYRGEISDWKRRWFGLSNYVIVGVPHNHPDFRDWIRTSFVINEDEEGNIETRNSRYKLIGDEFVTTDPAKLMEV